MEDLEHARSDALSSLLTAHPLFKNRPQDQLIAAAMDMALNGLLKR